MRHLRHLCHLLAIITFVAGATACTSAPTTCGATKSVPSPGTVASAGSPVVYVAGDSIVASGILSDPGRDGFAARLRARICGDRCGGPGQPTVVSVAAGGTRLTDPEGKDPNALIHKWPSILDATPRPTVIVVGIGINDVALTSDARYGDAYRRIVFSALERGIRVVPATMSPCNAHLPHCGVLDPQRRTLNGWLRAYWGAGKVADFSAAVSTPGTETLDPAYDSGDGLHLNAAGTQRIADSVPLGQIGPTAPATTPGC
jgi:lysophospholipase L1-like esterase